MKKLTLLFAASCIFLAVTTTARAQQFDLAFGYGTIGGTPASAATANYSGQYIGGGGYPSFSGDFLFLKHFGVGAEVAWRAHQNVDQFFQPYRPIFFDVNGVFAPPLGKKAQAELSAGLGSESLRFYNPVFNCNFFGCTNYSSSHHFLVHFGGGLRLYAYHNFFIRPQVDFYYVRNNFEFAGPRVVRYGAAIGYSLRNQQ